MKTKKLFGFIAILMMFTELMAQDYRAMVRPKDSKEWGYVNEKGEMSIAAQYRKCYAFNADGLAKIYHNKRYAFIDKTGKQKEVSINKFYLKEFSLGFEDDMVPVREKKTWGYMNSKGELAVEMKYEFASAYRDGNASAKIKNDFFILDKNGKESAVNTKDITEIKRPSEGMTAYRAKDKMMGFVDTDGEPVIKAKFLLVQYFMDGIARVKDQNELFGFIDKKGEWIVKPELQKVGTFSGGLVWARDAATEMIGFIDNTGKWVIKPKFEAAKNFDPVSGIARVKENGAWGYISKDGEKLKLNIQTEVYGDFKDGMAKGRKDKKFGFFGADGNWVIEPQFDAVGKISNGYIAAKQNDLWGYIDMKGNWVVKPQFDAVKAMMKID